jgi:hypothetical protein
MKFLTFLICTFFVIIFSTFNIYAQKLEDVLYLKNGSIIHGTIIEEVPGKSIKIQNIIGDVYFYDIYEVEKITKEQIKNHGYNDDNQDTKLKPELAFLWSFILPGGGQYYNGQYAKGLIMTAIDISCISSLIFIQPITHVNDNFIYLCISVGSLNEIISMVDAAISANKINRKSGFGLNYNFKNKLNIALKPDYKFEDFGNKVSSVLGAKISIGI